MEDDTTSLPPGWARVAGRYVERYGNARCVRWSEPLVYVEDGLPWPHQFNDPVLQGFARKAAKTLESTCTECGSVAKRRFCGTGWTVQCAACYGKAALALQIDELLDQAHEETVNPFDGTRVVWPEHELPVLLASCIPSECWRRMVLPVGQAIRYVSREDVRGLTPWFKKLQQVMRG